jgi:hypothetical protein
MEIAKQYDEGADWISERDDENVLLVYPEALSELCEHYPDAYDDGNLDIFAWTRIVFPSL